MFKNVFLAWKVVNYFNVYKSTMMEPLPKEASLINLKYLFNNLIQKDNCTCEM